MILRENHDYCPRTRPDLVLHSRSRRLTMQAERIPETIPPHSKIGKYEIVHRIAYGGMAEIYLARASGIQGFEKYVVLKRILPQYAAREDFLAMFLQEA